MLVTWPCNLYLRKHKRGVHEDGERVRNQLPHIASPLNMEVEMREMGGVKVGKGGGAVGSPVIQIPGGGMVESIREEEGGMNYKVQTRNGMKL